LPTWPFCGLGQKNRYDEFRHFVACAEQTRVTRSEMESLSKPEKGWQTKAKLVSGNPSGKRERLSKRRLKENAPSLAEAFPTVPPKNPMEFERDWRRHCRGSNSIELKLNYLELCGPGTLRRIFKVEIDVAILGQMLHAMAEAVERENVTGCDDVKKAEICFSVINVMTKTGRFSLNIQFLGEPEKVHAKTVLFWLRSLASSSSEVSGLSFTTEAVEHCAKKYGCSFN